MLAEENRGCYLGVGVGVLPAHMEVSYPLLTGTDAVRASASDRHC